MQPFLAMIMPVGGQVPGYPDNTLPGQQPRPDQGLPGQQPGIWGPNDPRPGTGLPGQQPGQIWGPNDPRPSHPITLPPDLPEELPDPDNRPIEWTTAWTQTSGWVVIGIPQGPAPTPSK